MKRHEIPPTRPPVEPWIEREAPPTRPPVEPWMVKLGGKSDLIAPW